MTDQISTNKSLLDGSNDKTIGQKQNVNKSDDVSVIGGNKQEKGEDSDYDWELEDQEEEARKKEKILKDIQDKRVVREYEEQKQKGTLRMNMSSSGTSGLLLEDRDATHAPDQDLDDLWLRIRNFFDDLTSKGDKREIAKGDKSNKLKFLEACESFDYTGQGVISESSLMNAFSRSRFRPLPSQDELTKLIKSLEAFVQGEDSDVNFNKILEAPVSREFISINGIFPKIRPKGPTQKQMEEQKRKEEEEKRKIDDNQKEERKRKEMADKRLADMTARRTAAGMAPTKEELKMKEREDQIKREAEEIEATRRRKLENDAIRKEVKEHRRAIDELQRRIRRNGENIRNWFNMFDANKDGVMEPEDFKGLLRHAGVIVSDSDLLKVFEIIDLQQIGKISYNDFLNVVEKNVQLPLDQIVRKRRKERGESFLEDLEADNIIDLEEDRRLKAYKTYQAELNSNQNQNIGTVEGLSQIMRRSEDNQTDRQFIDDDDVLHMYTEIKELLRLNFNSFDDILSKMGSPKITMENQVTFRDFEALVRSMSQTAKYSTQQIKNVFMFHAQGRNSDDAVIKSIDFKDKFFPGIHWARKANLLSSNVSEAFDNKSARSETSQSVSMHIDNVMAGLKQEDVERRVGELSLTQENKGGATNTRPGILKQKESKYGVSNAIKEELFERQSQSSAHSMQLDDIMGGRQRDPRRNKNDASASLHQIQEEGKLNPDGSTFLSQDQLRKFKMNMDFFRQSEAIMHQIPIEERFKFDKSLDIFFRDFCRGLIKEITAGPVKRDVSSYVDHYGKEVKGFLSYPEFKEIYQIHVQPNISGDESALFAGKKAPIETPIEEGKLRALFGVFDHQSLGRVSAADFSRIVLSQAPSNSVFDRLKVKVKKGGERMINVLMEEFQNADMPYGCQGQLPVSNFQTIMIDYDLPMMEFDMKDLRSKAFLYTDKQGNDYIKYKDLLEQLRPKNTTHTTIGQINKMITRVQAQWRGYLQRKQYLKQINSEFRTTGATMSKLNQKGVRFGDEVVGDRKGAQAKKTAQQMTPEERKLEAEKKKKLQIQTNKDKKKKSESLDARMTSVVKPAKTGKNDKLGDRDLKRQEDLARYIKTVILENIITSAQAYAESLIVGRTIQQNFENRPVTKFVFPMIQEFQYNVMGVQPKTLQTLNELGQIMYLDAENQLNQYDIPTNRSLPPVNLGTRPPLKHYDIIDMVCDQTSGRIYTLNQNWILEIWNIEQNVSLPQKRVSVCANEGGKDYIGMHYKNTFNNAKPRFLSLSDHNQQILIVNTSCVDGCIVFIDPISFSVLKKIQLRYQDYEIPKRIRETITYLKKVFKNIIESTGKTIFDIFTDITDKETQQVKLRDFVLKLASLDKTSDVDDLFQMCMQLDKDGNGQISLDEFLHFFQHLEESDMTEYEKMRAEEELFDNIWPEWIIKESKIEQAKKIIERMYEGLKRTLGISAELAFETYETSKDKGQVTLENFKKVLKQFFNEARLTPEEIDFVIKMTPRTVDQQLMYREFCRFLDKRFIRTFNKSAANNSSMMSEAQKELEQPLKKEASLNYIIRKSFELGLNLRNILMVQDQTSLYVIPRARFQRMLENLPLGLLPHEIEEIFDNDLNYDNYGNVDYTMILSNEIFVYLEQDKVKKEQLIKKNSKAIALGGEQDRQTARHQEMTDNRKVVVEDLVYIDDLEVLIYTTILPKTSTIFVTHTKKLTQSKEKSAVVSLETIASKNQTDSNDQQEVVQNKYELLAKLQGHRNSDPPTICYVAQSGCLVSGEKHLTERPYQPNKGSMPRVDDPSIPLSHKFQKSSESAYERHANRESSSAFKSEIIIWNIQRDMIELFQTNPPWTVPVYMRFDAHNASIIDICYLQKVQLLVSTSTDQTIRFFDPISTSYELTDPSNIPHAMQRPGYYRPLVKETTKGNITFKEVKRIYTGTDTSCYSLRCLNISNVQLDSQNPDLKSQIEWLVGLKLGKPSFQGKKNSQVGFVCGYGIERVKIEVPAIHHDDIVPPQVMKECEDLVGTRRRRIVTAFQHQLPHKIEMIYSQVSLQNSYMNQIRKLFLEAILKRKDLKYVNPEPLRQIYNMILKLPNRTKFENFLATSGCSDKLSVSETFFYLQKFMQIHPLRTTQIEFEKSISDFQEKHSREFLRGVKRWPKASVQKFANFIRQSGLDVAYLQRDSFNSNKVNEFCTRERFHEYFIEVIRPNKGAFSDEEIESILNELDPYFTGVIQIALLQSYYREEIHYHNLTSLNRPKQIFAGIRSKVFPNKKLALQQALTSFDIQGDGYIRKQQFVDAFDKAGIKEDRDVLEFLFDVVGEKFNTTREEGQNSNDEERILSVSYFINKLFNTSEITEINEIDQILQNLKAALIYKGIDFSIIFAEQSSVQEKGKRRVGEDGTQEKRRSKDTIDLTSHYSSFSQQLVAKEFCQRVEQLQARNISPEHIAKLANFLSLNQKNQTIVYLNAWLHHLRRVSTAFHVPSKDILPVICSKLLRNENVFRSYAESTAELKGKREDEKIIIVADLRQVLLKFGVNYINQDIFVNEFTRNQPAHLEDLITRMKNCVRTAYALSANQIAVAQSNDNQALGGKSDVVESLRDLRRTDYFDRVQMKLKKLANKLNLNDLVQKMKAFDDGNSGLIKVHHFINILKHNYQTLFDQDTLLGLQFELECLSPADNSVDYEEFVKIFLDKQGLGNMHKDEMYGAGYGEMRQRVSTFQIQDYEDLLSRINMHVKQDGIDLLKIFKIFAKQQGQITYEHLRKIFDLIGFQLNEQEFNLLTRFADESGDGMIQSTEFANQIVYAKELSPQFDINKWIVASRYLNGNGFLLERINMHIDVLKDILQSEHSGSAGGGSANQASSGVLTGEQFADLLRDAKLGLSEHDLDQLTVYSIKGSKRIHSGEQGTQISAQPVNTRLDLIHFFNFEKALIPVISHLKKESDDKRRLMENADQYGGELSKLKKQLDIRKREQEKNDLQTLDPIQRAREQQLVNKIADIFNEREITFFDCFSSNYDPLNPSKNIISITNFKKAIKTLNLPLTVQEHRILRRVADPNQIGKVDLHRFSMRFETEDLRIKRLNNIIERVATAFFVQNFNLRRAFALFDRDGDGVISKREFRQGWLTLGLDLSFEEIDDLMKLVDSDNSGNISYDEFISKMDIHLSKKTHIAGEQAQEIVFHKIKSLLDNHPENLYEIMSSYDYDNSGTIMVQDLVRAFKKLGMLRPEPHMEMLLEAGGARLQEERVDYVVFSQKLEQRIGRQMESKKQRETELVRKIAVSIQAKKMSPFEFFTTLDVNSNGCISKIELKTGMQSLGIEISSQDFNNLWRLLKKPVKKIAQKALQNENNKTSSKADDNGESLHYIELLKGFNQAGLFKYHVTLDNTNNLINKFRQLLKKKGYTVEKVYKALDPEDNKFVMKHDFIHECVMMGLEFSEEELIKIFEYICQVGNRGTDSKDQQVQLLEGRKKPSTVTRFTFKQLHDAILVQRDENWIYQAYIKIHGMVLQKNTSYKRLFTQWRDKSTKASAGRLAARELRIGLKKLRAGLTQDEIEKLMNSIPFEGRDSSIAATEFERIVIQGAKKLESEREYQKLALQEWITQLNEAIEKQQMPLDRIFQEHDLSHKGSLQFEDFAMMNEFVGLAIPKKELKRTFDIIDKAKTGRIRMEDIKSISQMLANEGKDDGGDDPSEGLPADELKLRQELDDLYEQLKEKLEKKNLTLEAIIYEQLKYLPNQFLNVKGLQQSFDKLQLVMSKNETEKVLGDVRGYYNGRFECSFKDFIDFMTRKRINSAFVDKGFVDPMIAQCCQNLSKCAQAFDLSFEQIFEIFDQERSGKISKDTLIKCMQGMELGIAGEDLIEFFNFMDEKNENMIRKLQFVDSISFVVSKIGGGSRLEQALSVGVSNNKKGFTAKQQVFNILKKITEGIQTKRLQMRQVIGIFDQQRTGYMSRNEFAQNIRQLEGNLTLEEARTLMIFFDDKNTGKISVVDVVKALQEIMSQQASGGLYAFMQVQPILQKIINELAVDCDKFFDEVADLNEMILEEETRKNEGRDRSGRIVLKQMAGVGLSKKLFYNHLQKYGIQLDEDEKTLLNTVFTMVSKDAPNQATGLDKFDYVKLDAAFEGVQQQLYAQEQQYTIEWQRRIFRKIGEYLRKHNITIQKCFGFIDEDSSTTVSIDELKNALIRFQINLTDKEIKMFLQRLDEDRKGYITEAQFLKKFWAAYTYDDVFQAEEGETAATRRTSGGVNATAFQKNQGLAERIKRNKMYYAIQQKLKLVTTPQEAFAKMNKGVGFLTVQDMQSQMPGLFGVSLKREDFLRLFKEIDSDKDGLVKYKELEEFFNKDYNVTLRNIEEEKQKINTQFEIFDHLMKVLNQKSLSLAEVFHQIDSNQNGFIECDEFQSLLERLGFTISEQQIYEIMRQMDENFDGRISYNELRMHIKDLGFKLDDARDGKMQVATTGGGKQHRRFTWRDKTIEVVIRVLNKHLSSSKGIIEFFKPYDKDHDNHLTPSEFRAAILSMKDNQLKKFQIERLLHILIDEKKSTPVISISKIAKFFKNYQYIDKDGVEKGGSSNAILIDEDLFVYIVEKYDGFSRLVEQINNLDEKSAYLQRHVFEINLRGLNMLSNQKTVEKLHRKSSKLNEIFESALILIAGEATRLMKEEAQLCVLDPTYNINVIVNDQNAGFLASLQVPLIENSAFDIDFSTLSFLPSGAQKYQGVSPSTNQKIEVLIYPNEDLNYVSADGKTYKKHLQLELQVQRYLMGAQFQDEENYLDPMKMDIFSNIGKFEKKIGLAASDKEIYVVNENIDGDQWICLDEFVDRNGGILNIPLFYHTDAPLFIIRYWAKKILQIIHKLHEVGVVMRSLNLKQIYLSRDGQKLKLANVRGVGKVNNLGNIQACPDIYLSLDNNSNEERLGGGSQTTGITPGLIGGNSSKKTEAQKQFSNRALDNPFIAPEVLFTKFSEHTSALDVWSFGMLMFCLLLGRRPESFYSVYRRWYKRQHGGYDIDLSHLPFIPPSQSNFLYDPFTVDFDNPFGAGNQGDDENEIELKNNLDITGSLVDRQGSGFNFENVMKCIKDLSISSLFSGNNSKKFTFKTIADQIKHNKTTLNQPPRFPGQAQSNQEMRQKMFQVFAQAEVLERKNELGLILDLVASCLDMDPKKRPTINGILNSPLFTMDNYELTNAVRFSQNVILYRSPQSSVSLRITGPLRQMCAIAIKKPSDLFTIENDLLKMFIWSEECVNHITSLPLDQINEVLTEDEKRKSIILGSNLTNSSQFKGKDFLQMRVSPNSPLAAQIIEDKVIDMLIFLTFRYTKAFNEWRNKRLSDINKDTQGILKQQAAASEYRSSVAKGAASSKTVKFDPNEVSERATQYKSLNQHSLQKKQTERLQNLIIQRLAGLLKMLIYEMHSYSTPMAPFVKEVMEYIVKFYVGEEYELGSDFVLRKASTSANAPSDQQNGPSTLKDYLRGRSFFRRDNELDQNFKSDHTDKMWHLEQKNKAFLDKSNYWNIELHSEALKIYKDAITESGMGQSCYPVINDYITNVSNSFEPTQVFSKQMNQLCLSFLIPFNRTSQYYNELIPLTECLARLSQQGSDKQKTLEKAGKRCSLAVVRSVFQTGSSDKIKACLDMRVPKHIIHFLQDEDSEVRHESLLIFYEISKGMQDDDFEINIGKTAANIKLELSKRAYRRTAFDQHKTLSLASQQNNPTEEAGGESASKSKQRRGQPNQGNSQQNQADLMASYIKRTTALIEKNDNDKFINFALDLPNLNFLANKRFLKELAICFESPVFIAPLIRLLKSPTESFANKDVILQILTNLFCGNEKVLIAINSPACDTYMTLLKMLMQNTKIAAARTTMGSSGSGLSAQMKQQLILQDKVVELFRYMFEQRRPTIIRDLSCNGAASTLLKEQGLLIPHLINLPEIVAFVDEFSHIETLKADMIEVDDFLNVFKDLRCWIKHFYSESQIPELTRIKALQRCVNLIIRVVRTLWSEFYAVEDSDKRADYLILMKAGLQLLDWLCVRGQEHFIFNEQTGRHNIEFIIEKCNYALSAFRHPKSTGANNRVTLEDLSHNAKTNKETQSHRKYDMFPFTEIGAILQNILYQLVRKNDDFLNQLLAEVDFGFVFGEQLILEYDFIRHCIDNKIESMVLIDTYVKKNEIRLNTYESLLRSSEHTLKTQFIKSNFFEKMFAEYVSDFKEFNIQFSKIDLEFLAFRKTFPIRLEAVSLINCTLLQKERAPSVFTEVIMYARRHFLIRNEVAILRQGGRGLSTKEATALLLFSIILESNEEDLIYAMMQEGAHKVIRDMMKEFPSLNKRYPILAAFTNKF